MAHLGQGGEGTDKSEVIIGSVLCPIRWDDPYQRTAVYRFLSLDDMIFGCLRNTGARLTSGFLAFDLLIPRKGLTCDDRCEAS